MKYLVMIVALAILTGCQSDVDKCVSSEMKSWKITNKENEDYNNSNKKHNEDVMKFNEQVYAYNENVIQQEKQKLEIQTGRKDISLLDLKIDPSRYKTPQQLKIRPVDQRRDDIVELEFRKNCMKLVGN